MFTINIFSFVILLACAFFTGWYACDAVLYRNSQAQFGWKWSREPQVYMHAQPTVEMVMPYLDAAAIVLSESVWSPFQVERQLRVAQENLDSVRAILDWEKNGEPDYSKT